MLCTLKKTQQACPCICIHVYVTEKICPPPLNIKHLPIMLLLCLDLAATKDFFKSVTIPYNTRFMASLVQYFFHYFNPELYCILNFELAKICFPPIKVTLRSLNIVPVNNSDNNDIALFKQLACLIPPDSSHYNN